MLSTDILICMELIVLGVLDLLVHEARKSRSVSKLNAQTKRRTRVGASLSVFDKLHDDRAGVNSDCARNMQKLNNVHSAFACFYFGNE